MKKYDKDATCSKCGGAEIEDKHQDMLIAEFPIQGLQFFAHKLERLKNADEFIQRTCNNCGYLWHEAPMDGWETVKIMDCHHAASCDECRPNNDPENPMRHGKKPCEVDARKSPMDGDGGHTLSPIEEKVIGIVAPVIEVGDEIRRSSMDKCTHRSCKAFHIDERGAILLRLWNGDGTNCSCVFDGCGPFTLIRKGPKVHRLEGVRVRGYNGQMMDIAVKDIGNIPNMIYGDKYTLTLTEED